MEKLLAEEAELTFLPVINPYYSVLSRPLLDLRDPEPYLAHARARKLRLEAARKAAAEQEQVERHRPSASSLPDLAPDCKFGS